MKYYSIKDWIKADGINIKGVKMIWRKLFKRGQETSEETAKIVVESGEHQRQLDIVFRALKKCKQEVTL